MSNKHLNGKSQIIAITVFSLIIVCMILLNKHILIYRKKPIFYVDQTCSNLGTVDPTKSSQKEFSFIIKNIGNDDLYINGVELSCPCSNPRLSRNKIEPEGQAELFVDADIPVRQGNWQADLKIRTNDPERRIVVLQMKLFLELPFFVEPQQVSCELLPGKTEEVCIKVTGPTNNDSFFVKNIVSPREEIKIKSVQEEKKETENERKCYQVFLSITNSNNESWNDNIIIETNIENKGSVELPVVMNSKKLFITDPKILLINRDKKQFTHNIEAFSEEKPFICEEVKYPNWLNLENDRIENTNIKKVFTFSVDYQALSGVENGEIQFYIRDYNYPIIVPIIVF
ncbi:DUF1573 domain-containing protein [Planctomycetota bacterium]